MFKLATIDLRNTFLADVGGVGSEKEKIKGE
jgi:hypothetical protein